MNTLTIDDIEAGYEHDDWQGHGYLGARQHTATTRKGRARVDAADEALLARANAQGWTADELFAFVNSKAGRWYGEDATGTSGFLDEHTVAEMAACVTRDDYNWSTRKCPGRHA